MNDVSTLPGLLDAHAVNDLIARRAPMTIIDVRSPAEFETAHIPGSYNVPLDLLPEHASDLGRATGDPVLLVCRSGARARQAEQALLAADLPRLHILDGGLSAWDAAGFALNRGRQRWSLERQVRFLAGSLVAASALGAVFVWTPLALVAAGLGGGLAYAAIADSCVMGMTLAKLPYNRGAGCDVRAVLRQMAAGRHAATRESAPAILSGAEARS